MVSVLPARSSTGRVACFGQAPLSVLRSSLRRRLQIGASAVRTSAATEAQELQTQVVKAAALSSAVGTFLAAGNVSAAQEVADIAAQADGRFGVLATLALPVLGWVGFNIFGPAATQLSAMQSSNKAAARSMAGLGIGLAALLVAQQATASTEVAELAAGDGRAGILFLLLVPVLGWVLFNILGPAQAQFQNLTSKRRGIAGAVGLTAASLLLATQQADAAQEVSQLAASDGRAGILFLLLVPVLGWVLFNILGPAQAQFANVKNRKRGVAGAVGLSAAASLLATQHADAASEVSQLAASDGRAGILFLVLVPVIGWVGFNIFGPAKAQFDNQAQKNKRR